ncbi:DUF4148 domain-containing protein [Paraburkholderia rhizosphaerae]|uniref:Uncharacterized protein DUF4148 n=1 Tax=Paraburkholderia rhizosphaerae TaxID=480658 RepID=A0A4R8LUL8_9BURK|nr:DUF4148 domain-containing protein [Paraburkholderia rhizosphaerae]TDY51480.1 uncharacterized protein DUF4148 [Paraburkholderia rhizosphaerae]
MKNRLTRSVIAAAAIVVGTTFAGTAAHSAQAGELTRAQVRAELAQLRAAGYDQSVGEDVHYPDALQQSQARVSATGSASARRDDSSGYGGTTAGTSSWGRDGDRLRVDNDGMKPIYFGQ